MLSAQRRNSQYIAAARRDSNFVYIALRGTERTYVPSGSSFGGSFWIDPESGTRPAPAAVPVGSASCARSEVDRKVGLDSNPTFLSTSDPAQVGHGIERAERFSLFKGNFRNPL